MSDKVPQKPGQSTPPEKDPPKDSKAGAAGDAPAGHSPETATPGTPGGKPSDKSEKASKAGGSGGKTTAKPEKAPTPKKSPSGRPAVLPWVVALLALLVLGAAGGAWYWWHHAYAPAMARLGQQVEELDSTSADTRSKLQDLESSGQQMNSAVEKLQAQQATINRLIDKLRQMQNRNSDDWVLAEVHYLLTVASERLAIDRDVDTAIAALQAADARLRDLANPGLIPVRQQIVHDLTSLHAVQGVDINGMALYLADLSGRIRKLPLKDETPLVKQKTAGQQQAPAVHNWRELLHSIWLDLRRLVVIREKTPGEAALIRPEIRTYLYENLRLELASARLAVLRRDTANLHASLHTVRSWLSRYFDTHSSAVSSVLDRLDHMSQVDLKPSLPDISGALDALQRYRRTHQPAGSPGTAAGGGTD